MTFTNCIGINPFSLSLEHDLKVLAIFLTLKVLKLGNQLTAYVIFQVSKKRAAEKMLEELKKLPPQSPTNIAASMARLKRKANPGKKKTRNLIKVYQQVSYDRTFCNYAGHL